MFYGASEGIFHIDQDVVSLTLNSLKGEIIQGDPDLIIWDFLKEHKLPWSSETFS